MKANELMIGDWMFVQDAPSAEFRPCRVTIRLLQNLLISNVTKRSVNPIPLTPEILEKNGFKKYKPNDFRLFKPIFFNPKEYRESDDHVRVFFTSKGFCFRSGSNLSIALKNGTAINSIPCYVHELQHALRLCRIEKEIVLWKQ